MTDNKKELKVLNGFIELNETEKQVFINEINNYLNLVSFKKIEAKNDIKVKLQSNLGPTNDRNCPCCGKS